jgi:hypothetical protein
MHKNMEFEITEDENNNTNYLDLSIHRHSNRFNLGIYRKPTEMPLYISHPTTQ